jgi:hypothetical protein
MPRKQANKSLWTLGDKQILVSYNTPVACCIDGSYYRTDKAWSSTTTRHINAWLGGISAGTQTQKWFNDLMQGHYGLWSVSHHV